MTPHQSIAVGVRLFAVWFLLDGFADAYFAFTDLGRNVAASALAFGLALTVMWVIAAVALWCFPALIARKLLPQENHAAATATTEIAAETWFATGCALIGIWVIVSTLPNYAQIAVTMWHMGQPWALNLYFPLRMVLGIYLILGAPGLRRVVRWAGPAPG